MEQATLTRLRAQALAQWERARQAFRELPPKGRVAAIVGLAILGALGLYSAWSSFEQDAVLHLKVQHSFRSAQIDVSVDGDSVYSGRLYGSPRKKFGFLSEGIQGSMSQNIAVSSGKHVIVVRVAADDGTVHEDSISGEFLRHNTRDLAVSARHSDVDLKWQGGGATIEDSAPSPAPSAPASAPSWLSRYATTILLSTLGSIVSALTGFAIRELPARIRTQPAASVEEKPAARSAAAGS